VKVQVLGRNVRHNSGRNSVQWRGKIHIPADMLRTESTWMSCVSLDISPCSPVKISRSFGRIYRFHLHRRRLSQARNRHETDSERGSAHCCFAEYIHFMLLIQYYPSHFKHVFCSFIPSYLHDQPAWNVTNLVPLSYYSFCFINPNLFFSRRSS
jgi:hypothetical protein